MSYGFVYILENDRMPGIYKIGCTTGSPRGRAAELSRATGVPTPFQVLCFAEFMNPQQIEADIHRWCETSRVSNRREFFEDCLTFVVQLLWYHPARLSFTDCTADDRCPNESDLVDRVCGALGVEAFQDLRDPYFPNEKKEAA